MRKLIVFILIAIFFTACKRHQERSFVYFRNFSATFNDMHEKHIAAAQRWGISPQYSKVNLNNISALERIESCDYYKVDNLTYSHPYLVSRAVSLLENIGRNFQDSLDAKDLPAYRLIVTSVLRTEKSMSQLRNRNMNASSNSVHRYGTTFDVAYARYDKQGFGETTTDKLKTVLAEVLRDLRKAKRCYVRYEVKQGCFHITVR